MEVEQQCSLGGQQGQEQLESRQQLVDQQQHQLLHLLEQMLQNQH
jgi:hypothetical protein